MPFTGAAGTRNPTRNRPLTANFLADPAVVGPAKGRRQADVYARVWQPRDQGSIRMSSRASEVARLVPMLRLFTERI